MNLSAKAMVFGSAIALGLMPMDAAQAFNLDLNGTTYELSTITGTFDEVADQLATQPWWGDLDLAISAAEQVGLELGSTDVMVQSCDVGYEVSCDESLYQLGNLFAFSLDDDQGFNAKQYSNEIWEYTIYEPHPCRGGYTHGCDEIEYVFNFSGNDETIINYEYMFGWASDSDAFSVSESRYYSDEPTPDLTWTWTIATSLEDDPQPVPEPGMIVGYGALIGLGIRLRRRAS